MFRYVDCVWGQQRGLLCRSDVLGSGKWGVLWRLHNHRLWNGGLWPAGHQRYQGELHPVLKRAKLATLCWIILTLRACVCLHRQRNYSCGFPGRCSWRWSRPRTPYWVMTKDDKYITSNYLEICGEKPEKNNLSLIQLHVEDLPCNLKINNKTLYYLGAIVFRPAEKRTHLFSCVQSIFPGVVHGSLL